MHENLIEVRKTFSLFRQNETWFLYFIFNLHCLLTFFSYLRFSSEIYFFVAFYKKNGIKSCLSHENCELRTDLVKNEGI